MKIELSTEEYLSLLDLLHVADVVMAGHRRQEDKRTERHRLLVQRLYGLAREAGLDRLMSYDETAKRYQPTEAFEEHSLAHTLLDEFGDHLFWDALIDRLSVRDAALIAGGTDRLNALNEADRRAIEGPIRQRYVAEFTANGTGNLEVVERFGTEAGTPVKTSD
jgi:hypothetical protein